MNKMCIGNLVGLVVFMGCLIQKSHGVGCKNPEYCAKACGVSTPTCKDSADNKDQACECPSESFNICPQKTDKALIHKVCGKICGHPFVGTLCQHEANPEICVCYDPRLREEEDQGQFPSILQRLLDGLNQVSMSYGKN